MLIVTYCHQGLHASLRVPQPNAQAFAAQRFCRRSNDGYALHSGREHRHPLQYAACARAQVRMGFPQRNAQGFAGAAFVGEDCRLGSGGYTCPRCRARVVELPSRCGAALTLTLTLRCHAGRCLSERQPLHVLHRRRGLAACRRRARTAALPCALPGMLRDRPAHALPERSLCVASAAQHAARGCCARSCHVCGLTLVSSPHLARSYHHLFPVPAFAEVGAAELARLQVGCWRPRPVQKLPSAMVGPAELPQVSFGQANTVQSPARHVCACSLHTLASQVTGNV